jgi:uncharacterized membrane protein YkoI
MPLRLLIVSICTLALTQVAARPLETVAPAVEGHSSVAHGPLQQARQREPGPADLKEAIEIAIERYGGEAAEANTVEQDGRRVHEIKLLLADGSVRTVRIDPATGAIIPPRER